MRWLVDGMNVIGTRPDGWWKDRDAAMLRLVDLLERWVAGGGDHVTVVFERPPRPPIRSTVVEVRHERQRLYGALVEHRLRPEGATFRIAHKRVDLANSEGELDAIAILL